MLMDFIQGRMIFLSESKEESLESIKFLGELHIISRRGLRQKKMEPIISVFDRFGKPHQRRGKNELVLIIYKKWQGK